MLAHLTATTGLTGSWAESSWVRDPGTDGDGGMATTAMAGTADAAGMAAMDIAAVMAIVVDTADTMAGTDIAAELHRVLSAERMADMAAT